jgi:hypothetical protein
MKRVIAAGKITTDHMAGERVLEYQTALGEEHEILYDRSKRNNTGPMMRNAADRQLIAFRIRR